MKKTVIALGAACMSFFSCGDVPTPALEVEQVIVNKHTSELLLLERLQLNATVKPENAEYTLLWSSSNTEVATVDNAGLVSTHKVGTAYIKASAGSFSDSCLVTVLKVDLSFTQGEIAKVTAAPYANSGYSVKDLYIYQEGVDVLDWTGNGYFMRLKLVVPATEPNALQVGSYTVKAINSSGDLSANKIMGGSYYGAGTSQATKYLNSWLYEVLPSATNYAAPITNGYITIMMDYDSYIMVGELEFSFLNASGEVFQTMTNTINYTGEVPINLSQNMPKNIKKLGEYTDFNFKEFIFRHIYSDKNESVVAN